MSQNVRSRGFVKLCIGTGGAIAVGFVHYWLNTKGYQLTLWGLIAFGVPGAIGAAGLLEMVSGIAFTELSSHWDDLQGWQRGFIGIFVVVICLGILIGGLALWGYLTM
ncbi:MAG: hypothetical protein P8017_03775 [Deltaproteobacteria bacterium]|jgi:hypothetical protein